MRIAIHTRTLKEKDIPFVKEVFDACAVIEADYWIPETIADKFKDEFGAAITKQTYVDAEDLREAEVDYVVSLGGDGTMLSATTLVQDTGIPILGINLGRLGFLASTEKHKIREALDSLSKGRYIIDHRSLLRLDSSMPLFEGENFALNDCTIHKRDTSSMIIVHAYLNGEFLNSYWADGLIVSTPTGSTGYSLSCGGPIIFPNSGNLAITPVAPHNLNVRPIVIKDDSVISFEIEGRADNFLCTLDSRSEAITAAHQIALRKADFTVKLIRLQEQSFLSTIRSKLAWGIDTRN